MKKQKLLQQSTDTFHMNDNVDKLLEEMAELQFALLKLRRSPTSNSRLKEVQGELADVQIALGINIKLFGEQEVREIEQTKLKKLKKKL